MFVIAVLLSQFAISGGGTFGLPLFQHPILRHEPQGRVTNVFVQYAKWLSRTHVG